MNWKNKVIWITGASSGIGKALADQFAKKGAKLILSSRNSAALVSLKQTSGIEDGDCLILPMDLSQYQNVHSHVEQVISRFGTIDLLINNAGISQRSLVAETDLSVDEAIFDLNFFGVIALTKAVLPFMIEQQRGHIAVTSSIVGKLSTPLRSSYSASKHALHGYFEALRAEVYDQGIHITMVCPGYIQTEISKNALNGDGSKHGVIDAGQASGMSAAECAVRYIKAIEQQKAEKVIAGTKEKLGLWMNRFTPSLFRRFIRNTSVT